jgi:hypothetical protein
MTSIKQEYCENCGDHTPHIIFKSMVGELHRCEKCRCEVIIDDVKDNRK